MVRPSDTYKALPTDCDTYTKDFLRLSMGRSLAVHPCTTNVSGDVEQHFVHEVEPLHHDVEVLPYHTNGRVPMVPGTVVRVQWYHFGTRLPERTMVHGVPWYYQYHGRVRTVHGHVYHYGMPYQVLYYGTKYHGTMVVLQY
jgi:hypothetical protein